MNKQSLKKDLLFPELSYKIVGALFNVWSGVGYGHKEKFYQEAATYEFELQKIKFEREVPVKMTYKNKSIGLYYLDFLIEDDIILELKVREYFSKNDIHQLYSYLKAKNLKLGILAHFTRNGVKYKRVINEN